MTLVNACGKVTAEEVTQVVAKVQEKIHSMKNAAIHDIITAR